MVNLPPWIETFTGKQFYFLDPKADQIDIKDIAHSLAYTCRYTGHSRKFYSVAEHSVFVSYLALDPLAGLLHDASEAYITDIASPIKPYLENYKTLEDVLMLAIARRFGFDYPLAADIKDCDATQLKTEAKHLMRSEGKPWASLYPTARPHGITPMCWSPEEAEKRFLERYEEVKNVSVDGFEPKCPIDPDGYLLRDINYWNRILHLEVDKGRSEQVQRDRSPSDGSASKGSCSIGSEDPGGCSRRTAKAFDMGAAREYSVRGGGKT